MKAKRGKLIVFSAPSGTGKTTIVKRLIAEDTPMYFSVSATTRTPRNNEINGVDYFFFSVEEFKDKITKGEFIEWEEVYPNQFYGSLHSAVDKLLSEGKNVVFDIDVKGGLTLKNIFAETALAIFILPPSIQELENRLKIRGTEDELSLKKRLDKANEEISFAEKFDVRVVNEDLDRSVKELKSIIQKFISKP